MKALRFALIGDPVAHSKSPRMQAAAFRALGLPHTYEAIRVADGDLGRIVTALRAGDFAGLNVTVPHKERVLALVDAVDAGARAAGAANTLVRTAQGRVTAYNTDAPALADEIGDLLSGIRPGGHRALVLGAGGAARAARTALAEHLGFRDVVVRARRLREAGMQAWTPSPESEATTLVVVQATSAGMAGADPGDAVASVVAWDALPGDAVAIDVVYAPPVTPFLQIAGERGLRCTNGLGMLARQGALALQLWLQREAPLDAMRAALRTPT